MLCPSHRDPVRHEQTPAATCEAPPLLASWPRAPGETPCDLRCTKVPTISLIPRLKVLELIGISAGPERGLVPTTDPGHTCCDEDWEVTAHHFDAPSSGRAFRLGSHRELAALVIGSALWLVFHCVRRTRRLLRGDGVGARIRPLGSSQRRRSAACWWPSPCTSVGRALEHAGVIAPGGVA